MVYRQKRRATQLQSSFPGGAVTIKDSSKYPYFLLYAKFIIVAYDCSGSSKQFQNTVQHVLVYLSYKKQDMKNVDLLMNIVQMLIFS